MGARAADKVYLESWMPGRARLRVPRPRSRESVRRIAARAGRTRPVKQVGVNADTGSVLVRFDVDDPIDLIINELRLVGLEIISPPGAGPTVQTQSTGAALVRRVASMANARLHVATKGHLDIRLAVPAVYALLAVRNFRKQRGRLRDAPWFQLAWWAFDSFYKLHEEAVGQSVTGSRGRVVG